MSIFVSIAAYRDPELVPTVQECLARAARPDELRFGICWQRAPDDAPLPWLDDPRFRILDVDWRDSRGACWARAEIMGLYRGEEHYLQLDSHHRFVDGWDARLLDHAARTGSPRPILTAYATPYSPGPPEQRESEPLQMNFDRFTEDAIVLFTPGVIPGWRTRNTPVRARFLSAHFLFAPGSFVADVPYDPELYFIGEEITLAVRAFTHGYDLFHPHEIVVWHEYTREYRTKHWDDHVKAHGVAREWHERDADSRAKIRRFLAEPTVGRYGLGTARTFAEYEAYAGLSFAHRRIQEYTRDEQEPPNPPAPPDWAARVRCHRVRVEVDRATLPAAALDDADFWYVGFHDAAGAEVYRRDASADELAAALTGGGPTVAFERAFETARDVASWTLWPHSRAEGWLEKITRPIGAAAAPATLVTALLDIGRGQLAGPFARAFDQDDLAQLERLLGTAAPMVVYVDPRHEHLVWKVRCREDTRVVPLRRDDLRAFPHYERVQEIRGRPDWLAQAGWLPHSPQAALADYNPLVMSKLRWLAEQARANPFGTEHLFWVDAGLSRTVGEAALTDPALGRRLADAAAAFLVVAFPYPDSREIHGFPTDALAAAAGVPRVDRVVRGGLFGGRPSGIAEVAALYDRALASTLAAGHMGTEESVLTLLAHREPSRFSCYLVEPNGLLGPFFDALHAGRVDRLRLPPESQLAPPPAPAPHWPPGVLAEDAESASRGATTFLGLPMLQNRNAAFALDELARHLAAEGTRVARVVEIGTGFGGFSVLLQLYCLTQGAQLITFDRQERLAVPELVQRLGIDMRRRDTSHEFVVDEIAVELQKPGVTLLFCDGPDKAAEVGTFADYLKPGDYVFAHDYAPSRDLFEERLRGRLWSWCEITDAQVAAPAARNGLEPVLPDVLQPAAWGGWVKRGAQMKRVRVANRPIDRVALYVLGYNSPDQLRAWIESVERAAPELLGDTERVLLNNSTDESTVAGYDELCRAYGFAQQRHGNLGINRGRVWCARHFDAETTADAMLYFEDDMLLHPPGAGLCANGFPMHVPSLLERAGEIAFHEDLDFLKLSFTELHGDHTRNWAYYNLPEAQRATHFPDGPRTRFEAIKSHRGLAYALGDVFYSNWPMLVTRRGNRALFLEDDVPLYEQLLMVRAHELTRDDALRGAVLLASPVNHQRIHHYPAEERREC